jgi:hypothetical protein
MRIQRESGVRVSSGEVRQQMGIITMSAWQPIETAPQDGSEILILTSVGATQARFAPGEWRNHVEGREYYGPVWVCCDDQWEIEIEDSGKDGMHHGIATHWTPLPAPPSGEAVAVSDDR